MTAVPPELRDFQERNVQYAQTLLQSMLATPAERDAARDRLELAPTPKDTLYEECSVRLYRFRPVRRRLHPVPLVIVPSVILRWYVMDLMRGHSLIEALVGRGIDVWLVDWGTPGLEHGRLAMDDYVDTFLRRCVRQVMRRTGRDRVSLLGQCLGGTLAAMYAALHPEQVERLACLTTPIDFEDAGLLSLWTRRENFHVDRVTATFGDLVPADFIHACFQFLDVRATVERYKRLYKNVLDENFMTSYRALDHWLNDKIPMPAPVYRQLIGDLYQENRLAAGTFVLGGKTVDLKRIEQPVLSVAAEFDHVFPEQSARAIVGAVSGPVAYHKIAAGHVTVVTIFPQREETYEIVGAFLRER